MMGGNGNGQAAVSVPPGFRFHPTDEELLNYYLRRKVAYQHSDVITDIDLNKVEPWDLKDRCRIGSGPQNEWYFFSHKDKKYPTGTRTNRATVAGFWKATGRDKPIYLVAGGVNSNGGNKRIGMRKTLVFYIGRAPTGQKSHWIMHEYRLYHEDRHNKSQMIHGDGWVVCRVFRKKNSHHRHQQQQQQQREEELYRGALMADNNHPYHLNRSTTVKYPLMEEGQHNNDPSCFFHQNHNHNPWEFSHNSIIQQQQQQQLPQLLSPDPAILTAADFNPSSNLNVNIGDWPILDKLVACSHQNLEQLIINHGRSTGHNYYHSQSQPQPQSTVVTMNSTAASTGGGLMLQKPIIPLQYLGF